MSRIMRWLKVRFIVAAITTFSAYAVYLSRINLSIALIAMVEDHHQHQQRANGSTPMGSIGQSNSLANQTSQIVTDLTGSLLLAANGTLTNHIESALNGSTASSSSKGMLLTDTTASNSFQGSPAPMFPLKGPNSFLIMSRTKFDWDQSQQGQILGAFFFGYILFQIPGARMSESVGARWIIMAATFGSALVSLAFPLSTQLNSIYILMLLRFVMGLCQSAFFPAAYVLFCRWLPEAERSILIPVMFIGSNIGSISTYIMSSYLISSDYGWPSVFYVSGLVCLLVSGAWCVFGSNGPEDNWLISDDERRFIIRNVNNLSSESNSLDENSPASQLDNDAAAAGRQPPEVAIYCQAVKEAKSGGVNKQAIGSALGSKLLLTPVLSQGKTMPGKGKERNGEQQQQSIEMPLACQQKQLPSAANQVCVLSDSELDLRRAPATPEPCWSKLLKSVPVWTLILSMYGNEWSNVVLCYELPTYLNTVIGYPIERNGVINSFFQFSYAVASPIMSSLGTYMLDRRLFGMHKIHVRKLFQSLATFGQLACFLGIAVCGLNIDLIILLMFASMVFRACSNAGDLMVPGDLSPEYAGTIFAFANSVGNTAGFVVPMLAGYFVKNPHDHDQWTPFWLTSACIMGASGLIFLLLGETRRQDFSLLDSSQVASQLGESALPPFRRRSSSCASGGGCERNPKMLSSRSISIRTGLEGPRKESKC